MKKHKIGWLNFPGYSPETVNPVLGCSKASAGCDHCYALKMAARQVHMGTRGYTDGVVSFDGDKPEWTGKTVPVESELEKVLRWKKPRAIFWNSMGEMFHPNTPAKQIDRQFAVMALTPQHLHIVLTKRAEVMGRYFLPRGRGGTYEKVVDQMKALTDSGVKMKDPIRSCCWPLPNVILGVTAENQEQADLRIPHLLRTPAACRFVSVEPMLGPVDLELAQCTCPWPADAKQTRHLLDCPADGRTPDDQRRWKKLDWVICGGESGPGARPMKPAWARSLRDQCNDADVSFFFKQWGDWKLKPKAPREDYQLDCKQALAGRNSDEKHGGDVLGGRQHHEFPDDGNGVESR